MFNKMKHMKNEKGLTLIELLAVIVILAIIAAIAIPAIGNIINNSRDKAILSEASNMLSGAKIAIVDGGCGAAVSGVITCNSAALEDVYEGTVAATDKVVLGADGVYTITFAELAKIKNIDKFSNGTYTPPATVITEAELVQAMSQ